MFLLTPAIPACARFLHPSIADDRYRVRDLPAWTASHPIRSMPCAEQAVPRAIALGTAEITGRSTSCILDCAVSHRHAKPSQSRRPAFWFVADGRCSREYRSVPVGYTQTSLTELFSGLRRGCRKYPASERKPVLVRRWAVTSERTRVIQGKAPTIAGRRRPGQGWSSLFETIARVCCEARHRGRDSPAV